MEEVIFKPKFFSRERLVIFIVGVLIDTFLVFFVFPALANLYHQQPDSDLFFKTLMVFSLIIPWIIFSFYTLSQLLGNKISVKGNQLTFYSKEPFSNWRSMSFVTENISLIEFKKRTTIISPGRGGLPVSANWLVIKKKDGSKDDVNVNWLGTALKDFVIFLKEKYPNIKLSNIN